MDFRLRTTRPCASCGGKRTCRWVVDAWVCWRCEDEWYPDHDPVTYGDPASSDLATTVIYCKEEAPESLRPKKPGGGRYPTSCFRLVGHLDDHANGNLRWAR